MLTNLTYLAILLSLLLWLLSNYISTTCEPITSSNDGDNPTEPTFWRNKANTAADTPLHLSSKATEEKRASEVLQWFKDVLPSDLPRLSSSCPPAVAQQQKSISNDSTAQVTVIGEINLNSSSLEYLNSLMSDYVSKSRLGEDIVISSFLGPLQIHNSQEMSNILQIFNGMGLSLVSLAHQHSLDMRETRTTETIHSLESTGIKWVGVNARKHEILQIGKTRVGVLAFCGVQGKCLNTIESPFTPNKYSVKTAKELVVKLQQHRVDHVIALLYWGNEHGYFPDETALYIARHISDVEGVDAVIGYHPRHVQGHAYFGNTLVVFSPGNIAVADDSSSHCWEKGETEQWQYRLGDRSCQAVHPALRDSLLERELQTNIYRLRLTKSAPVTGEYKTIALQYKEHVRYPSSSSQDDSQWRTICGEQDDHCLACQPF